jgi:hypothetical protein
VAARERGAGHDQLTNAAAWPSFQVFALYVVACGYVPTESGRGQTKRGASKESVDKERIRRSGGRLARTCRANGVD